MSNPTPSHADLVVASLLREAVTELEVDALRKWAAKSAGHFAVWITLVHDRIDRRVYPEMLSQGRSHQDEAQAFFCVLEHATPEDYCRGALDAWVAEAKASG